MIRCKEEVSFNESGATLEQVAKRRCRCPVPRKIQSHVGQGSEQPALVEGVTVH